MVQNQSLGTSRTKVYYRSAKIESGVVLNKVGQFESKTFSSPLLCFMDINGPKVQFRGTGINETVEMRRSRAKVERRWLTWQVWFPLFNGHDYSTKRITFPYLRDAVRPNIIGSDPRTRIILLVAGCIATSIHWIGVFLFLAAAGQTVFGFVAANKYCEMLNALCPGAAGSTRRYGSAGHAEPRHDHQR
jgi:hypothetical protein